MIANHDTSSSINEEESDTDSQFNLNYGTYEDPDLGLYTTNLYDYPNEVYGSCQGVIENQGCFGIGEETWLQNPSLQM